MIRGRPPIFAPALEGSRTIIPRTPFPGGFRGRRGPFDPGPPGSMLPPIGGPAMIMPAERISVPSLMQRHPMGRGRYMGPPSLEPGYGGFSYQGQYFPDHHLGFPGNHVPGSQFPGKRPPWDDYMGPGGRPPQDYFQYREGERRHKHGNLSTRPSSMFLFGIILKEIVAALHRIFLNPSGNIYPVLNDIIGPNAYDLSSLVRGGQMGVKEEAVLIQEMQYVVENLIYHITEIMPRNGVLGTHRKSAVFELIRSNKRFPDGYFWKCEMERLQFDEHGRTCNVGDAEGFLLFLGIFISRSLITTILMKPVDYGLSSQPLSDVAERNLRIVATTLLYLVRRIAVTRNRGIMAMPYEIARYLYTDEEMTNIYSKLSRTFNYCEGLLREWITEYIRRLRGSSMHEYQQQQ